MEWVEQCLRGIQGRKKKRYLLFGSEQSKPLDINFLMGETINW